MSHEQTWILIGIGVLLLILILVVLKIFLGTIGTIGLIRGAQLADQDMEARLTFGELFKGSLPYFWRVFLLNLLVGLVFFVVGIILAVGVVLGVVLTLGLILICLLPLLCLLVPLGVVIGVVIEQATIAIVAEDLGILDGLRRGWEVVKTNVGPMIVMWLILGLAISGIGGIIIGLPMILVFAPFLIGLFANAATGARDRSGGLAGLLCGLSAGLDRAQRRPAKLCQLCLDVDLPATDKTGPSITRTAARTPPRAELISFLTCCLRGFNPRRQHFPPNVLKF